MIENSSTIEHTAETASANQHGRWLRCRSILGPNTAVNTAAASGASGISQRTSFCADSGMLLVNPLAPS
jgi:hypothetical protein